MNPTLACASCATPWCQWGVEWCWQYGNSLQKFPFIIFFHHHALPWAPWHQVEENGRHEKSISRLLFNPPPPPPQPTTLPKPTHAGPLPQRLIPPCSVRVHTTR